MSTAPFTHPKTGYLYKKGRGTLYRPWKYRKFVLGIDYTLSYYDDDGTLKGNIKLSGADVKFVSAALADGKDTARKDSFFPFAFKIKKKIF